jgi:trehalose 2-sulfotransferase
MAGPSCSYLIAANQRSGTTLLCRALTDTGVAGRPEEYFLSVDPVAMPEWRTWEDGPFGVLMGATDRDHYLQVVYDLGTTPNGVFGAKLMANNLPWAIAKFQELPRFAELTRAEVLHAALPGLRIVEVTRRDRIAQAVSWARAAQDGVWVVSDDEPTQAVDPPEYDAELIGNLVGLIEEGERAWRDLYAELGVVPCEVVYEDLVADDGWAPTIRRVLDHLGLDLDDGPVPPARVSRQADELNAAWAARFRQELS